MEPDNVTTEPSEPPSDPFQTPNVTTDASRILSFSAAITALKNHPITTHNVTTINTVNLLLTRTSETITSTPISILQTARLQIHPTHHLLAYITTLDAVLSVIKHDAPSLPSLLSDLRTVISSTPPALSQIVHKPWVSACRHAVRLVIETNHIPYALSLVSPLRQAADKQAPHPDYLVPTQADFLAICIQAKCYKLAATWIRRHRRLRVISNLHISATDVHLIYHYSTLVFIGLNDFRAALQSSRLALAVPAPSPGNFFSVALVTFKIFLLLHLLVSAISPPPFKFCSYPLTRMRKLSSEYIELGCAYERMDSSQIQQIFISNTDLFQKQHTYYLVKKVVSTLSKQLIIRLTNSFVTMKIHDVAERVGLRNEQHAHALLFEMIKHDMISANIDDRRGIVSLMDNDIICEKKISSNISKSHMNHCLCIVQRIEDFRENLGVDPEYVCKEMTILQSRRSTSNLSALGMVAGHDARAMASLDAEFLT